METAIADYPSESNHLLFHVLEDINFQDGQNDKNQNNGSTQILCCDPLCKDTSLNW